MENFPVNDFPVLTFEPRYSGCRAAESIWLPRLSVAVPAELLFEEFAGQSPQLPDRFDAQPLERASRRFSNAPQPADRERVEELLFRARRHNDEPVGLVQVAGDLGEKFIRGDDMRAFIVSSRAGSLAGEAAHQHTPEMHIEALDVEAGGTIDFIVDVLNSDQYF